MSSGENNHAVRPEPEPTDELLLAQSLDTCLRAESVLPGSSAAIVARVPEPSRTELAALLATARLVESSTASATPSAEFKAAARARLMRKINTGVAELTQPTPIVLASIARRSQGPARRRWMLRGLGGLVAAGLTAAATLTASASALPGEPLYTVKQAKEEVAVRIAADDQARALALVQRANARLDETTRLLQQGRTEDAVQTALQFDESVDRATSTLVTALGPQPGTSPAAEQFAVALAEQQVQIENVLPEAPPAAQAELREALQTTERGRALAANPAPVKQALARPVVRTQTAVGVAASRIEATAETRPTDAPTSTPVPPTAVVAREPQPEPVLARAEPEAVRSEDRRGPDTADASVNRGRGDDQRSGGDDQRSGGDDQRGGGDDQRGGGPGPQAAPRVTAPAQPARPAVQVRPNTSGPGPADDQRGGGEDSANARGSNADERGNDQRGGSPAVANDQRGGPNGGDDQRGGSDDDRRRGGDNQQQPQQAQSQQQPPTQAPSQGSTSVARNQDRGQDGGDNQRAGGQAGQDGQNGQAARAGSAPQNGSGDAPSSARAATAPVTPPSANRNNNNNDDTGGQAPRRADDQVAVKPAGPQATVQQQPARAPTATPMHQQNTPPAQTQNPSQQNNNRAPATTTTPNRNTGGRNADDDSSSKK